MAEMRSREENGALVIYLCGSIDSTNNVSVEQQISDIRKAHASSPLVLDCSELSYISSAGLRTILRLKKTSVSLKLTDVKPEVYSVFETTGFTQILDISKALRVVSVEGCEVIGRGANGKVYRIDRDTIVKAYNDLDSLPEIQAERELARTAFVMGIPTAIPYDVVRIKEGGYGSVFELLDARTYADLLKSGEKTPEEIAAMCVELLKIIHSAEAEPGLLPDMKKTALGWASAANGHLAPELYQKLCGLIVAVPDSDHVIHGDFHLKNIMLHEGESLLIDMDSLCSGYHIFEFAGIFNAYRGFSDVDHTAVERFLGIDYDTAGRIWKRILELYIGTEDPAAVKAAEDKAAVLGFARMLTRTIRLGAFEGNEEQLVLAENCKKRLEELIPRVDTLIM